MYTFDGYVNTFSAYLVRYPQTGADRPDRSPIRPRLVELFCDQSGLCAGGEAGVDVDQRQGGTGLTHGHVDQAGDDRRQRTLAPGDDQQDVVLPEVWEAVGQAGQRRDAHVVDP